MKVLLDTNLLISYLLSRDKEGTIQSIVEGAFIGKYTLLLPQEVITELKNKLITKKYLAKHISLKTATEFATALFAIAEIIPAIKEQIPKVGRDRKDDYLISYAVVGNADYLVSGDADLQIIKEISGVKILSPIEFYKLINKA